MGMAVCMEMTMALASLAVLILLPLVYRALEH
jgi:hypothetical protein